MNKDLILEFAEDAWYAYHLGEINNQDDYERFKFEWIDSATIYRSDCKEIVMAFDENVFDFKPTSWRGAATD